MEICLTHRGAGIRKEYLTEHELRKLRTALTVTPETPGQKIVFNPKRYPIYQESLNKIYVPKHYALEHFSSKATFVSKTIEAPLFLSHNVGFTGSLRDEQRAPVKALLDAPHGGVLNIACGGGKTTMALYAIHKLGMRAVIIVHKDFLLTQWRERIEQFLPAARIGLIKGPLADVANKDIVIASLQSLAMKEYPRDLFDGFGTLVVDEVHHTSAEVFNRALFKTSLKFTIGLTATVDRKDGLSKVFLWHLGPVVFKAEQRVDTVNVYTHMNPSMPPLVDSHPSRALNQVCENEARNKRIIALIESLPANRKTLVLSDRIQQLKYISKHLTTKTHGMYIGGMKSDALKACEDKQVIFATYAIASEGYDQKGLDTLVLSSPRSDVVQSVGRILREKEADRKTVPEIHDFIDMVGHFAGQWRKRRAFYKKCGYAIQTTK